jgi:aryl-alcohol dehydrogenase-like predicted oxidoreductase
MRTAPLGHTGVEVSALCLGAMYFGTKTDEATSRRLLDEYIDAGGSFIDTANIYARWIEGFVGGESEALLGRWMRDSGNRSRLFIATKTGIEYPGTERGLRAHQINDECDKSLKRLGIDTIDLYYAHIDDRSTPLEETLGAFAKLVEAGKVRFIGVSNMVAWRLEQARRISRANGWPEYEGVQQRYSYLRPRRGADLGGTQVNANEDLLDYCHSEGITLLPYSVLLAGAYTRPDRDLPEAYPGPDNAARMAALNEVARETGLSLNQVVLAWMMQSDVPTVPLIAASTSEQLRENLAALDARLSADQMARLDSAGV